MKVALGGLAYFPFLNLLGSVGDAGGVRDETQYIFLIFARPNKIDFAVVRAPPSMLLFLSRGGALPQQNRFPCGKGRGH